MDNSASIRNVLHILFKHKIQLILFFTLSLGVAFCAAVFRTPVYVSSAKLLVKLDRDNLLQSARGDKNSYVFVQQSELIAAEREIFKSRVLIEETLLQLGPENIYTDLAEGNGKGLGNFIERIKNWLPGSSSNSSESSGSRIMKAAILRAQSSLWIEDVKKSNLMNVGFNHPDSHIAAQFLDRLIKNYMNLHLEIHQTRKAYDFFKQETDNLKSSLREKENRLNQIKDVMKITSFEQQQPILLKRESEIRDALSLALRQQAELDSRIAEQRKQIANLPEKVEQGQETGQNPYLINTLEARLVELELKEKELMTRYTEQNRLVVSVRDEIRIVKDRMALQTTHSVGKSTSGFNPMYQNVQRELLRDEIEARAVKSKIATLKEQLDKSQQELLSLNELEEEYAQLKRQVDIDRDNYRLYLTKLEESRISDAMDMEKLSNVKVVEPARAPIKPSGLSGRLILLLGVIFGFFGGFVLAVVLEFFDESLETPEDIDYVLKTPVLTSIPYHGQGSLDMMKRIA